MYNLTKVPGNQTSMPSERGEKKYDYLNYDLMAAIFEDIVMFNYYEFTLNIAKKGAEFSHFKEDLLKYGFPYRDYDRKKHDWCMATMTRDFSDLFNFFSVNIVTKAFTDVVQIARNFQIETNHFQEKKQGIQVDRLREGWNEDLVATVDSLVWQMSDMVTEMREASLPRGQVSDLKKQKL